MSQPTHKVIIHRHAMADLEQYYRFVWKNGGDQASAWYERFVEQLKSLDRTPERCPIARESKRVFLEVRELHFGRSPNVFRVLFTIDGDAMLRISASFGHSGAVHLGDRLRNPTFRSD